MTELPENFADYPKSIAEIKGEKLQAQGKGGADEWSPRDALIAALRDIDSGVEKPVQIYIAMEVKDAEFTSRFPSYVSCGNRLIVMGLLAQHLADFNKRD